MLLVAGEVRVHEKIRATVFAAARADMLEARKDPSCLSYSLAIDLEDNSVLHVSQAWNDRAAYDAHADAPSVERFQRTLTVIGAGELRLRCYEVRDHSATPD